MPGEEWVTLRADIDLEYRPDAERLETVPTGTTYCGFSIVWVNSLFHDLLPDIYSDGVVAGKPEPPYPSAH